jgi:hypothetical protein
VIFVVISALVVVLIHGPSSTFYVFAVPPDSNWGKDVDKCSASVGIWGEIALTCCWNSDGEAVENDTPGALCQQCNPMVEGERECGSVHRTSLPTSDIIPPQDGVLEQPPSPTPRTPGQSILPGEGVLEQPPTSTQPGPRTPSQGVLPQNGVLEQQQQQPTDEGLAAPRTIEPQAEDEATQPSSEPLPPIPARLMESESGTERRRTMPAIQIISK